MTPEQRVESAMDDYLGCFGNYRSSDPVCRKRCALNLRCAITCDQNERVEILEDLVSGNDMVIKFQ